MNARNSEMDLVDGKTGTGGGAPTKVTFLKASEFDLRAPLTWPTKSLAWVTSAPRMVAFLKASKFDLPRENAHISSLESTIVSYHLKQNPKQPKWTLHDRIWLMESWHGCKAEAKTAKMNLAWLNLVDGKHGMGAPRKAAFSKALESDLRPPFYRISRKDNAKYPTWVLKDIYSETDPTDEKSGWGGVWPKKSCFFEGIWIWLAETQNTMANFSSLFSIISLHHVEAQPKWPKWILNARNSEMDLVDEKTGTGGGAPTKVTFLKASKFDLRAPLTWPTKSLACVTSAPRIVAFLKASKFDLPRENAHISSLESTIVSYHLKQNPKQPKWTLHDRIWLMESWHGCKAEAKTAKMNLAWLNLVDGKHGMGAPRKAAFSKALESDLRPPFYRISRKDNAKYPTWVLKDIYSETDPTDEKSG